MLGPLVNAIEPVHGEALVELADADNTVLTILLNACADDVPEVLLVTADEGGVKGAELVEVFLPPVRLIELPGVAAGILAAEVKGLVPCGSVINEKPRDVEEVKFILVSTPIFPITILVLLNEVNEV